MIKNSNKNCFENHIKLRKNVYRKSCCRQMKLQILCFPSLHLLYQTCRTRRTLVSRCVLIFRSTSFKKLLKESSFFFLAKNKFSMLVFINISFLNILFQISLVLNSLLFVALRSNLIKI